MSEKLIVNWDDYNQTVEKLAIQIHESGYKPSILFTSVLALIILATVIFIFKN